MYGDRRVRPTFARESAYIVVRMERDGHVRLPRGFLPWKPGKRVFFCVIDGLIFVSYKPMKLYRGRYISSVLKRTVWRKSDGDFMRRVTLNESPAQIGYDAWFRCQIKTGLRSANAGNLIPAEEVEARFASRRAATRNKGL